MLFSNVLALGQQPFSTKAQDSELPQGSLLVPYIMSMTIVGFIWKSFPLTRLYQLTNWGSSTGVGWVR